MALGPGPYAGGPRGATSCEPAECMHIGIRGVAEELCGATTSLSMRLAGIREKLVGPEPPSPPCNDKQAVPQSLIEVLQLALSHARDADARAEGILNSIG